MPDLVSIFQNQPEKYDLLVSREDHQNKLLKRILEVSNTDKNSTVLDMGAGSGRISFLLSEHVKMIHAFDKTEAMINCAKNIKSKRNIKNITFQVADNLNIPMKDNSVDLGIEGWAFLAMKLFSKEDPVILMKNAVQEMQRVVKNNGIMILIETQGTCVDEPILQDLPQFKILVKDFGFHKEILRTDYKFSSMEEALELVEFFFDAEAKEWLAKRNTLIAKEYTGFWWKKVQK